MLTLEWNTVELPGEAWGIYGSDPREHAVVSYITYAHAAGYEIKGLFKSAKTFAFKMLMDVRRDGSAKKV